MKVKKNNRKRIALAKEKLSTMNQEERQDLLNYTKNYCKGKVEVVDDKIKITSEAELKLVLFGIEERFYTTPITKEDKIANSVVSL